MKVAVIADIHGNLAALERIAGDLAAWQPELVVVNGDIVNRGPEPLACLRFVQAQQDWLVTRGNHEDYVISRDEPDDPRHGPEFEMFRNSYWTYQQLGGDVGELLAMPDLVQVWTPDGAELRATHAAMGNARDGIYPDTSDAELARKIAPPPQLFVTAHTHIPLVRQLNGSLVVNTGSVGMPFDGDRRASYARLVWQNGRWSASIVRLAYDWERTLAAFEHSGFLAGGGPLARLMRLELRQARSHLHLWLRAYGEMVLNGRLDIGRSVDLYLAQHQPVAL